MGSDGFCDVEWEPLNNAPCFANKSFADWTPLSTDEEEEDMKKMTTNATKRWSDPCDLGDRG
jgi:hypothetical protein